MEVSCMDAGTERIRNEMRRRGAPWYAWNAGKTVKRSKQKMEWAKRKRVLEGKLDNR